MWGHWVEKREAKPGPSFSKIIYLDFAYRIGLNAYKYNE
jgi:hypothetical protein